jgi:nucleotide-binding universal stress UspA family protein
MKTILFPTDFSQCAANAFIHALELASRQNAELVVLHVVFPNEGVDNNVYNAFWTDDYLAQREKGLKDWVRRKQRKTAFKDVKISPMTQIGFPVASICEAAENRKADLIIMGTTGATGLRDVFLGSVAAGVMGKTTIPQLVVPKKAEYTPMRNVVMATDFNLRISDSSKSLLQKWLKLNKSQLHMVHILDKPGERPDKGREKMLAEKLGVTPKDFHYLHDRDVPQAISNFMESLDAQALVSVARDHSLLHRLFFDSVTRKLAHRVKTPMLVLHEHA